MPVVLRAFGLRFVIYVHDHEPAHVHVYGDGEAKIAIGSDDASCVVLYAVEMTRSVERRALRAVVANRAMLLEKWSDIHG